MTADRATILSAIRRFVIDEFLKGEGEHELGDDTHLVKTGVVDSLNVLRLVEFIEEGYDMELEPADIQKFTSVANIADGITAKLLRRG